jgi:prostamide/prostaglandin F2alpha synthase
VPLGASRRRQETHPPDNADALAALVVQDVDGNDVRLGDLWAERPVVLVWLRHYG